MSVNHWAAPALIRYIKLDHQFSQLAHLHVSAVPFHPGQSCIHELFRFLTQFPNLCTLHLSGYREVSPISHPSNPWGDDGALPAASMPNLRRLWFSGWHLPSAFFLVSQLILNPDVKLGFGRCLLNPQGAGHPEVSWPIPRFPGTLHDVALAIGENNLHLVGLGPRDDGGLWIEVSGQRRSPGILGALLGTRTVWARWVYERLLPGLPRADARSLHMHAESADRVASLIELARSMQTLRALDVSEHGEVGLVADVLAALVRPQPFCPFLETLALDVSGLKDTPAETFEQALIDAARTRAARGSRLRRVTILSVTEPEKLEEWARALRGHVDEVQVLAGDGYQPSRFVVDGRWTEDDHGYWEVPEDERPAVDTSWMRWGQ